jgi:hypothetical protein
MLRFFTWRSFERWLRFARIGLKAVLVPMLCVGMHSGGSASHISGRATLKPIRKAPMDNAQIKAKPPEAQIENVATYSGCQLIASHPIHDTRYPKP